MEGAEGAEGAEGVEGVEGVEGWRVEGPGTGPGPGPGRGVEEVWRGTTCLNWAWRPDRNPDGGSIKFLFRYLKIRMFKKRHRIHIYTFNVEDYIHVYVCVCADR